MDCASEYRCHVCCRKFKKFIIFEGHFAFNRKCRENFGFYMQCYMCLEGFNNLAALKYHIRSHKNVRQQNDACGTNLHSIEDSTMHSTAIATNSNQINGNENVNGGSPKGISYYCKICNLNCRSYQQLERHTSIHTTGKLKCEVCNFRFTKGSLTNHIKNFHPQLDNRKYQFRHANTVHKYGKFECTICKIRFTKKTLSNHQRMIHPDSFKKKKTNTQKPPGSLKHANLPRKHNAEHQCQICKAYFTLTVRHMHYSGKLTCKICKVRFNCLKMHNKQVHPELLGRPTQVDTNLHKVGAVTFSQCKFCKLSFRSKNDLAKHEKCHRSINKCKVCNVPYTRQSLWRHLRRAHPGLQKHFKEFVCNVCKLNCKTKHRLHRHKKVHIGGGLECEVCHIPFTKSALISHKARFHPDLLTERDDSASSQKIYNCTECSESFTRNRHLQLHMKSHCDKNFECYVCGEQPFSTFNDLSSHLNKHEIYQRWVDPANIQLSDWSHAKSHEILENQPLVLVENLDVSRINLKSLSDFIQRSGNDTVDDLKGHWRSAAEETEPNRVDDVPFDQTGIDEYAEEEGRRNETASSGFAEAVENVFVPVSIESLGPSPTHYSLHTDDGSSEALPVSIQPIDSMCSNDDISVIDISSDDSSDDDEVEVIYDISQVFYCAFCNELCYSLNDLGFHNKMCLLSGK